MVELPEALTRRQFAIQCLVGDVECALDGLDAGDDVVEIRTSELGSSDTGETSVRQRIIPVLLLGLEGLVKTVRFSKPTYVGDPVNAVRIFNEKEVDELILLDICATVHGRSPRYDVIEEIAQECFMPLCYGGGVRSLEDIQKLANVGVEKVAINTRAVEEPEFLTQATREFAGSSIVVAIDVKRGFWGRPTVWTHAGRKDTKRDPVELAREIADRGAGEVLLTSIDRDGTMQGYDGELIQTVSDAVPIPVIACGGAGSVADLQEALRRHASAAAAGSLFVFQGRHRAVLISYPSASDLRRTV